MTQTDLRRLLNLKAEVALILDHDLESASGEEEARLRDHVMRRYRDLARHALQLEWR